MHKTDFLFAQPGFIRGMGRALDLGSTKNVYNGSSSADEADFRALKSDWTIVGDDIRRASHQHGRKKLSEKKLHFEEEGNVDAESEADDFEMVELPESIEKLNLDENEKIVINREIIAMRRSITYSGPLPHPSMLREYDNIIPNGAERIFNMAENQAKHRQSLEKHVVKSNSRDSFSGIFSAFILSMFTIACGTYCVVSGFSVAGVLLGGAGLASLVGTFIYGTRSERQERKEKREDD